KDAQPHSSRLHSQACTVVIGPAHSRTDTAHYAAEDKSDLLILLEALTHIDGDPHIAAIGIPRHWVQGHPQLIRIDDRQVVPERGIPTWREVVARGELPGGEREHATVQRMPADRVLECQVPRVARPDLADRLQGAHR